MPISADRFEELGDDRDGPTPGTNADRIIEFLRQHPDKAFTQSEIADETGVKSGSVGPTLVRLRERGRVDHRGKYWRVSDHDRSVNDAVGHAADDEMPSMADWQEHAVDPREHRDEQ
ncbi:helix-turn-helix transcriptional regulator [Halomicrobium urmianum]|uniref:helix-turn-helix transcriptional regulator n=1 Tax=Halomicrobium urmianum TaxID=1586233 RepID=UPI001CD9474E|nr:winged helix-turn-helix domain-containing protein [Halomicrobium urmianum]